MALILDSRGQPLKRTMGFVRGYVPERKALPLIGALYVVGMEVPLLEEDEEEADAARTRERMRRVA
jgi:hypothetical protein